MNELIAILSAFYGCHALMADHDLSKTEMEYCTRTANQVQVYFLTKAELTVMQELPQSARKQGEDLAIRRFKAWEIANPKTVKLLKAKHAPKPVKKETLI